MGCLKLCFLISAICELSFFWILTSSSFEQRRYFVWHLFFKIYWDLICGVIYSLHWKISHVLLRRMYILLLGRVFCICVLDPVGLLCCLILYFFTYVLSGYSLHYGERDTKASNYYCKNTYFSLQICHFFFIYFDGLSLVIQMFIMVTYSCCIESFVNA